MLGKANSIRHSLPRLSSAHPFALSLAPRLALGLAFGLALSACDSKPGGSAHAPDVAVVGDAGTPGASGASGASAASGADVPVSGALDPAKVTEVLNPQNLPAYDGPTASIEGTVRISGPRPPDKPMQIPVECESARGFFGPLFRKGPKGELADALVAVTGYGSVYVPAKSPAVMVEATDCTWDARTYALTYGQRLEVKNIGKTRGHVARLLGSRQSAMPIAIPGGAPVSMYPDTPGHMQLSDASNLFMAADVFIVRYPTTDVTDGAGHYRIDGIPVGEVTVNALLPATQASAQRVVTLKAGETAQVDFELTYEPKK